MALTVFRNSHYGYAGLIMSYHMLDDVVRGMLTPPDEVAFTNPISSVLCISDTLLLCLVVNFSGETIPTQLHPNMMRNFNTFLCY